MQINLKKVGNKCREKLITNYEQKQKNKRSLLKK